MSVFRGVRKAGFHCVRRKYGFTTREGSYRSRDSPEMKQPIFTRNVVTVVGLVLFGTVLARSKGGAKGGIR